MEDILRLAKGNPGAVVVILQLIENISKMENIISSCNIINTIDKLEISGTDLYVFHSDICNKDFELMSYLCNVVPPLNLKDACSKQDYSGREILKTHIDTYVS